MILNAIREGEMLTKLARERAFELEAAGLINMQGCWALTPAGNEVLDRPAGDGIRCGELVSRDGVWVRA